MPGSHRRRTPLVLVLAVAASCLFGCTVRTAGAGHAEPSSAPGAGPTGGQSAGGDLDGLAPCTLLSDTEQAGMSLRAGQDRVNDGRRVCAFPATDETFVVAVTLYPDEGLDTIDPATILSGPLRIGGHDAVQHHENRTACVASIAVDGSSSVDVGSTFAKQAEDVTPDDLARSCETAHRAAGLVEPRLP